MHPTDKETRSGSEVPDHLRHVVEEAERNPYEAFASAAVALLFHDQQKEPTNEQ